MNSGGNGKIIENATKVHLFTPNKGVCVKFKKTLKDMEG